MSNLQDPKGKFVKFISGKGFYAVLAVCLIGAGTAAWVAVDRTIDSIDENNKNIVQNSSSSYVQSQPQTNWDTEKTKETKKEQTNVEISSKPTTKKDESVENKEKKKKSDESTKENTKNSTQKNDNTLRTKTLSYVLPIEGDVINQFSDGKLIKDVTLNEWRTHNGIDIKATVGTPVVAVTKGKVEKIYTDKVWGDVIEISQDDGITSIYASVTIADGIKIGDVVNIKQVIGKTGTIPSESALEPHLHFAMKKADMWMNPLKQMGKMK